MKPDVTLYPYQEEGRDFILKHRHVLIGDEMGLGKTIQALAVMDRVEGDIVVVCPAMLRNTWHKEIAKFTDLVGVFVVSYEGLKKLDSPSGTVKMVVFDEAHYLKNTLAKRTRLAHAFVRDHRPEYCVLLSGTPIRNGVGEFYSLLKLLSSCGAPNGLALREKSQYAFNLEFSNAIFEKIYVRGGGTKSVARFSGVKNAPMLRNYLRGKYLRRTADKVLSLPSLTSTFVDLSKGGSNPDQELSEAFESWLDSGTMTKHVTHLKIKSAMGKVAYTVPFIRNMVEQGESVVVFTDHIDPAMSLVAGISDFCSVGCITGSVSQEDRTSLIELFQAGQIKVLVCSIKAAGVGITLTSSRIVVFNDISWVPADIDQAKKRIHRIGQDKPCMIYHVVQGSFDESIQKTVMAKSKLVKEIL